MEELKRLAAAEALKFVKSGMVLGVGTGSTVGHFIELLGEKVAGGELTDVICVPTSEDTAKKLYELKVGLASLDEQEKLDLAVDGADEVDPSLNLIKGLGKALLREKVVEIHAEEFVVIVDESKVVDKLGTKQPLPVEIVPFAKEATVRFLGGLQGCRAELWLEGDGSPATTDNGNCLAKCYFEGGIDDAVTLAASLSERPGIVEHGLFLNMATKVLVAGEQGVSEMSAT